MINPDDWKIAIEDARHRHAAVIAVIYFTDSQAMALLRVYVTVGLATAAGAVASFTGSAAALPQPVGFALASATIMLAVASWFCFRAMDTTSINPPGRGAEFWLWVIEQDVARDDFARRYLQNLVTKTEANLAINKLTSSRLSRARKCAVWVPLVSLAVGVGAHWVRLYI